MTRYYSVISADGHLEVPPDAWVKFVPEKWKDRAPRLVSAPEGGHGWIVENRPFLHTGPNITGGGSMRLSGGSYKQDDGTPSDGTGPPDQRLREQDRDGIDAEVLFPPFFASAFIEGISEVAAYRAMVSAYNTFLAEDFCSAAPDRLIGSAIIPVSGIGDACAELRHIHELGLRCVSPHQFPNGTGYSAAEDDAFWELTLELGLRVAPHICMGEVNVPSATPGRDSFASVVARRAGPKPVFCLAQLIMAGVFDRFAQLQLFFAETNGYWIPGALYFMDDSYELWKDWFGISLDRKPSEYIMERCYFSIVRDPVALRMGELLPFDRIMWGSDFPHSAGSFPHSREFLDEAFAGLGADTRRQVLLETPAKYFGLDLSAQITETPKG